MTPTDAVKKAKLALADLFSEEQIYNLGLEEIHKSGEKIWAVTLGFSRPWDREVNLVTAIGGAPTKRSYKVVNIDDNTGECISIVNRAKE